MSAPDNVSPKADRALSPAPAGSDAAAESTPAATPGAAEEFAEYEPLTPELVEEEAIRGDFVLRCGVVLLAFLLGSTRIADTSTLVHVKTGQYLAKHGILPPAHDVFSYTADDRPWTNLAWGFDLISAGVHALGSFAGWSFAGLSLFKALAVALAFWLVGRVSRPGVPTWWGSVCAGAALLACQSRLAMVPTLVTFIGVAAVFWLVHGWRESGETSKRLWLVVPLFVVWSNLDSRAWVGLVFLLLYAAGDALGAVLGSPAALSRQSRKMIWIVAGASILATLVHPFGWKSLAAPWFTFGVEYPALRGYLTEAYLGAKPTPIVAGLQFFPMTTPVFWTRLDIAAVAALAAALAALVTFVLNRARLDFGHVCVFAGFALLGVACLHELPVAAIVCAAIATLNGQAWYAANCRQTYSVETRELVFSRGGRALTVLAFAGIAFFAGTGRLRDAAASRTGYGLDRNLELQLHDLSRQLSDGASFDHRPFHTLLTQGDQLIWAGERVFVDSRVAIYYAPKEDDNLLAQQVIVRDALQNRRDRESQRPTRGPRRTIWQKPFKNYGVTHVVVRLGSTDREESIFTELLQDNTHWEWTSLGATSAVFYRLDVGDPELDEFVKSRKIDFRKRAFSDQAADADESRESDGERGIAVRDRWIKPPTLYQKYFWSSKHEPPPEILEAGNLINLAIYPRLPQRFDSSRAALAFLAIRLAQAGLNNDPDAFAGYLVLGQAYDFLSQWEALASRGARPARGGMRYMQAVAAFNVALLGDPGNPVVHQKLMTLYIEAQKPDLALLHLEAFDQALSAHPDENAEAITKIGNEIGSLRKRLQTIDEEIAQRSAGNDSPLNRAQGYIQRGCILKALDEIDKAGDDVAGNLQIERVRIQLLLEAGRVEEAVNRAGRFVGPAQQKGIANWYDPAALASLTNADYAAAAEDWKSGADMIEKHSLMTALLTAAPHHNGATPWPISTTQSALDALYQHPEQIATLRVNVALTYLEEGRLAEAKDYFLDALATNPDTANRSLIAYYLGELTEGKEQIDIEPPSNRVFESFAPEGAADGADR